MLGSEEVDADRMESPGPTGMIIWACASPKVEIYALLFTASICTALLCAEYFIGNVLSIFTLNPHNSMLLFVEKDEVKASMLGWLVKGHRARKGQSRDLRAEPSPPGWALLPVSQCTAFMSSISQDGSRRLQKQYLILGRALSMWN